MQQISLLVIRPNRPNENRAQCMLIVSIYTSENFNNVSRTSRAELVITTIPEKKGLVEVTFLFHTL
jgi:hypothetical protein